MTSIGSLRSLDVVLRDDAEQLRADLEDLLKHSSLEKRFGRMGGLAVITPTPFRWLPLPTDARGIQVRLRDRYRRFSGIIRALLADAPQSTRAELAEGEKTFLFAVEQIEPSQHENPREAGDAALEALEEQLRFVDQLHSIGTDPIVVPDTNAVIFNPALEDWAFEDELPKFRIALTPTLLRELDELKMRTSPVRTKAEQVIRRFGEYRRRGRLADGVPLRNGVSTVFSVATEPRIDTSLPWLDAASQDDRLIASAIDLARRSVRVPVVIATRDLNLENKADFIGIPTVRPPEPRAAGDGP